MTRFNPRYASKIIKAGALLDDTKTLLSHWDGYNFNRNNYRVYFDATTGKAVFFCHGMDQAFSDPNAPAVRDSGTAPTSRCP